MGDAAPLDLLGPPLRILILSPQPWIGLQVSKHHYAREAARLGHEVVFVNPPGGADRIAMTPSGVENITLLDHPPMPLRRAKFRARWLFDRVAKWRAKAIVAATGPIDLLWDFDNARQFADHRPFGARLSILHLVDRPADGDKEHRYCDLIIGLDASLVSDIESDERPVHLVGHGLSPLFAGAARQRLAGKRPRDVASPVTVGFIGNLAQPAMDRARVSALIAEHREVRFRFIGPVQGETSEIRTWVDSLRAQPNVEFAGLLTGDALIAATIDVDVWLLCYDPLRDRNRGVNSHKLLEYFALGGEVVSSWIDAQSAAPGIFMASREVPDLITDQLSNAVDAVRDARDTGWRARIEIALTNGYAANFRQIAERLATLAPPR